MTASIEILSNPRALGVVVSEKFEGPFLQAPIAMVRKDQAPDRMVDVRQDNVSNPAGSLGVDAPALSGDIVDDASANEQPGSIRRRHQQMSSFGQLKFSFAGCEEGCLTFSNCAGNIDDYVWCSFDIHSNSSIQGGIYSVIHPQFTCVVSGASKLSEHEVDQSNSPEPGRFNESERFCSDCAWPVACRELQICQRRELGDIRSRCPWAPSQVFQ